KAVAFLSDENIHPGVDRVVAVYADGRAYAWQQLNESADQ
ncbi:MAG: histidine kinase, partial [Proteobacteria bacterium]|nr:histidine kinase [Pseudomonadota bacterium]